MNTLAPEGHHLQRFPPFSAAATATLQEQTVSLSATLQLQRLIN